jgi:hypothetical protein
MRLHAAVLLALAAATAHAANRCTDEKGRVTYQDEPCASAAAARPVDTSSAFTARLGQRVAPVGTAAAGGTADPAYSTYRGAWRGPTQLHLTSGGKQLDPDGTAQMVIEIKPDGAVAGFIDKSACRLAGLATAGVAPYIAMLDVTASGCADARFNARYQGSLGAIASAREARFNLSAVATGPGQPMRIMSVAAVLTR